MNEEIIYKKTIFATIIRGESYKKKEGINFFTKNSFPLQVAYINHKRNHVIMPHVHLRKKRKIFQTSEVLIILKGKLKVDFYTKNEKFLKSRVLKKNDIIVFLNGGHGFYVKEKCSFIEVKQGPFFPSSDKKRI